MNYYEHHIGDYDQATAHLTACEDGIYSRMIRWYMASEEPLPADVKLIQRRVRAHSRDEKTAVQTVLAEFFRLEEDGFHMHRCDEEIARFQDKQAKAKRSAEARWSAHRSQSDGNADAYANASSDDMRTHSEGNAPRARPQTPDSRHQYPPTPTGVRFAEFWTIWPRSPRKVGRAACEKTWKSRKLDDVADAILAHVAAMKHTDQWQRGFEPAPATYLNQRRWEDGQPPSDDAPAQTDWTAGAV